MQKWHKDKWATAWQNQRMSGILKNNRTFSRLKKYRQAVRFIKPEDHWSCIAHLSPEDMLKSVVIKEKTFKHQRSGADNPRGKILMSTETSCHFGHLLQVLEKSLWSLILYIFCMILYMYIALGQRLTTPIAPGQGAYIPQGTKFWCHFLSLRSSVASFKS